MAMIKTYTEMMNFQTFDERLDFLRLNGSVGLDTFGSHRYLNQTFYKHNKKWKDARRDAILRDNGCDLGIEGLDIFKNLIVHHINPITIDDILEDSYCLYDLENLVTVSFMTHQAIHYGTEMLMTSVHYTPRSCNDTCPWKKG